jgi:hypothetical protein
MFSCMENPLPRAMMLELLADVLMGTPAPAIRVKYEYRIYAASLVEALNRVSLEIAARPKVVALSSANRRSTRQTREVALQAWTKRLDDTGDQVAAFEAALRVTLARERGWGLGDAVRHTMTFVAAE